MLGRLAAPLFFIDAFDCRQIQLIDHVANEVDEVAFRQPIAQTGGQQQILLGTRIFNLMFYIPTFQRPSASLFIGARAR